MNFQIGTRIYASSVTRGMIIDIKGEKVDVDQISEGYDSWEFTTGSGRKHSVYYGARVELLGWFNPEEV